VFAEGADGSTTPPPYVCPATKTKTLSGTVNGKKKRSTALFKFYDKATQKPTGPSSRYFTTGLMDDWDESPVGQKVSDSDKCLPSGDTCNYEATIVNVVYGDVDLAEEWDGEPGGGEPPAGWVNVGGDGVYKMLMRKKWAAEGVVFNKI
jgi:hypothetical protein